MLSYFACEENNRICVVLELYHRTVTVYIRSIDILVQQTLKTYPMADIQ